MLNLPTTRNGFTESAQDAAMSNILSLGTSGTQGRQLLLQGLEFLNPLGDVPYVLIQNVVDGFAAFFGRFPQLEQNTDFIQRHVQGSAMPDEGQLIDVGRIVDTVVGGRSRRHGQQALSFIEPDGFHRGVGQGRQFTDLHGISMFASKGSAQA